MSNNPPRIVVCRQDADFSFLHGTSEEIIKVFPDAGEFQPGDNNQI